MHLVNQNLGVGTCRGPWYWVTYCKGLACVLHNLVVFAMVGGEM